MTSWNSYPSIFNLGHKAVSTLLSVAVNVEEKVDGSQFSFGLSENYESGILVRSKGAVMQADAPERMFTKAVETAKELKPLLTPGYTYRCEYLRAPKHNTLCYNRIPNKHLILFDVTTGHESYLSYEEKANEAARLGLEVVPLLYSGMIDNLNAVREFLDRESILGGQKIEGVVIKPRDYNVFGQDKKLLLAKFVSENFQEAHSKEWKTSNPTSSDILALLAADYKTTARWQKAVIHLRERGEITDSPKDIGPLLKEIGLDTHKECADEIKAKLFKWAWPHIQRKIIAGFPEWYKEQLAESQFDKAA